jgi:acetyltransferase-like isoleucine patch superfamily enzyme
MRLKYCFGILQKLGKKIVISIRRLSVQYSRTKWLRPIMTIIAEIGIRPYHSKEHLAWITHLGYSARNVSFPERPVHTGRHVYLGDGTTIDYNDATSEIILSDHVAIYGNSFLKAGFNAKIYIGHGTHIQPGCHIQAYLQNIEIGSFVEIGANCGLYSYDHGMKRGITVMNQALESHGQIVIENGVWLGHGVIVLSGVRIGHDSVVGAGSVVTKNIPANAIAAGVPAKVISYRS